MNERALTLSDIASKARETFNEQFDVEINDTELWSGVHVQQFDEEFGMYANFDESGFEASVPDVFDEPTATIAAMFLGDCVKLNKWIQRETLR